MPQVEHTHPKFRPATAIIAACALVAIVAGLVLGLGHVFERGSTHSSAQDKHDQFNSVMAQAATLEHQKKYAQEQQLLKKYLHTNPPGQYQYLALMKIGNLAYDQRQDADAVNYYKQAVLADNGKLNLIDAQSIAMAAAAGGDKATAIEYYRQAIKLTDVRPGVGNNIDEFKAAIQHLGGTP
jgi:tetratricopeptide (TPR) repeat protein